MHRLAPVPERQQLTDELDLRIVRRPALVARIDLTTDPRMDRFAWNRLSGSPDDPHRAVEAGRPHQRRGVFGSAPEAVERAPVVDGRQELSEGDAHRRLLGPIQNAVDE